jgi:hypothetical protein
MQFPSLHYRFSTPPFFRNGRRLTLPDSDASKTGDRIQKTGFRIELKWRRQKSAVRFIVATPHAQASKPGSLLRRHHAANDNAETRTFRSRDVSMFTPCGGRGMMPAPTQKE